MRNAPHVRSNTQPARFDSARCFTTSQVHRSRARRVLDAICHRCSRRLTLGDGVGPSDGWRSKLIRRASISRHGGQRGLIRYLRPVSRGCRFADARAGHCRSFKGRRAAMVRPVLDALAGFGMARRLDDGRYVAGVPKKNRCMANKPGTNSPGQADWMYSRIAAASASIRSMRYLTRSPIDTNPTSTSPSITGRCRIRR